MGAWFIVGIVLVLTVVSVLAVFAVRATALTVSPCPLALEPKPRPPPLEPLAAPLEPLFRGTRVPARVVFTYFAKTEQDLEPSLRAALNSWRVDEDAFSPKIVYYNDAAAREFLVRHMPDAAQAWDALVPAAFKADVFRACEIYLHGGLYCDIKCTRVAPYASLIGRHGTVAVDRSGLGLWNGCFAAPPGAPWVGETIQRTLANVRARTYATSGLDITGPTLMGRAFRAFVGFSDASASCEFMRADVLRGPPGADWGAARDWGDGAHEEVDVKSSSASHGLRVLAMRVSNSDYFDVVSGPGTGAGTAKQVVAFKTTNDTYRKSRQTPNPVSNYTFAYNNRLVYYPLPPSFSSPP
jgi:hypothetical protein